MIKTMFRKSLPLIKQARNNLRRKINPIHYDLMSKPQSGYTVDRATAVYGEVFRRCFEYIQGTNINGDILEFGSLRGFTARVMASLMKELNYKGRLHLYDSFEGLPEISSPVDQGSYEVAVNKVWFLGQMKTGENIDVLVEKSLCKIIEPSQFEVVKGYFEDTLKSGLPEEKASLVHIDCDLYSSSKFVMDQLIDKDLFQDGCLLLFDDFNCNRANPQMGERKALVDAFENQDKWIYSAWFSYGWHGQSFFVHEKKMEI